MKDNSVIPLVERVGSFSESKFGIASGEDLVYIFDILRNKLYSDKALAVVREYVTNAYDANIEAGNESRPIVISAPSSMTPQFKVRDFGRGLSETDIRNIYCMYGRSTKRNSNEFTGQLGLGSKSGFAYGESFGITSYLNGTKTVYIAYIDESKLGSVAKVSEEETKEDNGIEIDIPVKKTDISVFSRTIANVIKYFKIKPTINGSIDQLSDDTLFKGEGWIVNKSIGSYYGGAYGRKDAVAVMGNIAYPINPSQVYPEESNNYWNNSNLGFKFISGLTVMFFDIGQLSIAASREELEYNDVTIKAIKCKALDSWNSFKITVGKDVEKFTDLLQAKAFINKSNSTMNASGWSGVMDSMLWRDKKLLSDSIKFDSSEIIVESFYSTEGKKSSKTNIQSVSITQDLLDSKLMFLCDDPNRSILKCKSAAKSNPGKLCLLFKIVKNEDPTKQVDWFEENDFPSKYLKNISEYTIPAVEKESKPRKKCRSKNKIVVYTIKKNAAKWNDVKDNWEEVLIEKSDVKFYIPIFKFKPILRGVEKWISLINDTIESCKTYDILLPKFYGVKTSEIDRLEDDAVDIIEHVNGQLKKNKLFMSEKERHTKKSVLDSRLWDGISVLTTCEEEVLQRIKNHNLEEDCDFMFLINFIKKFKLETYKDRKSFETLNSVFVDTEGSQTIYVKEVEVLVERIKNRYPMIEFTMNLNNTPKTRFVDTVCEYIKIVEKSQKISQP